MHSERAGRVWGLSRPRGLPGPKRLFGGRQLKAGRPAGSPASPGASNVLGFVLRSLSVCFGACVLRLRSDTTSNGGPLGSCIDEERSKLRYVV